MSILPFMKSKKKETPLSDLFDVEQIKRAKSFGGIVMCNVCGGLFNYSKCEEKEVIRHPRRGGPWVDHEYYCKGCRDKKDFTQYKSSIKF